MSLVVLPRPGTSAPPAVKAGPVGPGASVLLTELPLSMILGNSPTKRMQTYMKMAISVPWIRAAERVIGGIFASVDWHLEDGKDAEVDDEYPAGLEREALDLLSHPQRTMPVGRRLTRSELWRLTCRHLGAVGNAFWYKDQPDAFGRPAALLYIRPDRMTPNEDAKGNLLSWQLDKTPNQPGTTLELEEVVQFVLEPPDSGHFGIGLIESALMKAELSGALDRHLQLVLSSGGRLSGLMSPKDGAITDENAFQSMVRDARSITEQPDAAKRLHILRAPVEFQKTTMSPDELQVADMMSKMRDDLLALWGVPLSQLGVHDRGRGLGASEITNRDDATLWRNALHPRLAPFVEAIQSDILDAWAEAGHPVELEVHEPEFDDRQPVFEMAAKAESVPLRNRERRDILGLEPFGPDVKGPTGQLLDDEVWLPSTLQVVGDRAPAAAAIQTAAADASALRPPERPEIELDAASRAAGETTATKASLRTALERVREVTTAWLTPEVAGAVGRVLQTQRADIAASLRANADHLAKKPRDAVWWDGPRWDRAMAGALRPALVGFAENVDRGIRDALGTPRGKAAPWLAAVDQTLTLIGGRIVGINDVTREAVQRAIVDGLEQGLTIQQIAAGLESGAVMGNGAAAFDAARAEVIARTETAVVYNAAAIGAYSDVGVTEVQAIDGDKDEECASRNGRTYSLEDASGIVDHPNGTLDWVPIVVPPARPN